MMATNSIAPKAAAASLTRQRYINVPTQAIKGGRACGEIQRFGKEWKAEDRRLAQVSRPSGC